MKLSDEQMHEVLTEAKDEGRFRISGLGLFKIAPRRKGKISSPFGDKPRFAKRVVFTAYDKFKELINS